MAPESCLLPALVDGLEMDRFPVRDRGLMYGDGLFETVAVRSGRPCLWREHLERLDVGARRLGIPCPPRELLWEEGERVVGDRDSCVLKIVLTRGMGGRGYRPPADARPTRILLRYPAPQHPTGWREHGVAATYCRVPLGENPYLCGIKHLNRLEQVLARAEWDDPQIAEGLMLDGRGRIIGGTMTNLFLLAGERLLTPRLDTCGVSGTVRARMLRAAAALGIEARETDLTRKDLAVAEGLLLTNALIGVWTVRSLGHVDLDPGLLPRELIDRVIEEVFTPDDWRID
jgi:4-amino-4-deoxychorismate lyase